MNEPVLVGATVGRDRRVLKLLVVGLLLVVLVGVVGPRLVSGGDDDDLGLPSAVTGEVPPAAAPGAPGVDIEPVATISARNPFLPVGGAAPGAVPEADPAPAPPAEAPVSPAPTEPPPVFPIFGVVPVPEPGPPPVPGPEPRVVRTFALLEVFTDGRGLPAARIAVDGEEQLVAVGQDVAGSYRVLSLNSDDLCGVFLYGDRRFALCQGEEAQT